jgi:hypothetical protein
MVRRIAVWLSAQTLACTEPNALAYRLVLVSVNEPDRHRFQTVPLEGQLDAQPRNRGMFKSFLDFGPASCMVLPLQCQQP